MLKSYCLRKSQSSLFARLVSGDKKIPMLKSTKSDVSKHKALAGSGFQLVSVIIMKTQRLVEFGTLKLAFLLKITLIDVYSSREVFMIPLHKKQLTCGESILARKNQLTHFPVGSVINLTE